MTEDRERQAGDGGASTLMPMAALIETVGRFWDICETMKHGTDLEVATRRRELVRLRRILSGAVADVGIAGEDAFADDATLLPEFRRRFSELRSRVALHQAEWPAVDVGRDNDDLYLRSAVAVQRESDAFVRWIRAVV